jgi:type III restriction enzyme
LAAAEQHHRIVAVEQLVLDAGVAGGDPKWANMPIAILGVLWNELRREWADMADEPRPPVFILVCKNTPIARVIYQWLGEDDPPTCIPPAKLDALRNTADRIATIRMDTKVVQDSETEGVKIDEVAGMRLTLDTAGRFDSPAAHISVRFTRMVQDVVKKLNRPLPPAIRDRAPSRGCAARDHRGRRLLRMGPVGNSLLAP